MSGVNDLIFNRGDVIDFCDEQYIVINGGSYSGSVYPIGADYWVSRFHWRFQDSTCKFIRHATEAEMKRIEHMND